MHAPNTASGEFELCIGAASRGRRYDSVVAPMDWSGLDQTRTLVAEGSLLHVSEAQDACYGTLQRRMAGTPPAGGAFPIFHVSEP